MTADYASSFLNGANAPFIAELYERYLADRNAVDGSWQRFFDELRDAPQAVTQDVKGASWAPRATRVIGGNGAERAAARAPSRAASADEIRAATIDSVRALMLIRSYRIRGHLEAILDPLNLLKREPHPELDPATYGFSAADMDREIFIDNVLGLEKATLRTIL
ncbi:MAG: 2-oxoglutarate dehydrogenase E1 component, partial [Alphaproteobacteria bacterium]|nr:2-oxoglutarate dehydrogenase E1 component [Alphaproteobacteria bacterium]